MTKYNHCGSEANANSKHKITHFKNHLKAWPKKKKVDIRQIDTSRCKKKDGTLTLQNYQFDDARS